MSGEVGDVAGGFGRPERVQYTWGAGRRVVLSAILKDTIIQWSLALHIGATELACISVFVCACGFVCACVFFRMPSWLLVEK